MYLSLNNGCTNKVGLYIQQNLYKCIPNPITYVSYVKPRQINLQVYPARFQFLKMVPSQKIYLLYECRSMDTVN